jgi:uncharacterized DUF497 family protein
VPLAGYEWNEAKNRRNRHTHGVDFSAVEQFEWDTAVVEIDDRENFGELRERATGFIGDVLHVLVFTRRGETIRLISLRKANNREKKDYVQSTR